MAAPTTTQLVNPCRVIYDPANTTASAAYGGTLLGTTQDVVVEPRRRVYRSTAEEFGGAVSKEYHLGYDVRVHVTFAGYDADAWGKVFFDYENSELALPGPTYFKSIGATVFQPILLAAEDPAAPSLLIYKPSPNYDQVRQAHSGFRPYESRVTFLALPYVTGGYNGFRYVIQGTIAEIGDSWPA